MQFFVKRCSITDQVRLSKCHALTEWVCQIQIPVSTYTGLYCDVVLANPMVQFLVLLLHPVISCHKSNDHK